MTRVDVGSEIEAVLENADPVLVSEFTRVCRLSNYVYQSVNRYPELIADLFSSEDTIGSREEGWYLKSLAGLLQETSDDFDQKLREFRRREMIRVIFRDFSRRSDLIETTRDLSLFAEASIHTALLYHYQNNVTRFGTPISADGDAQQMCVLALGKLGAYELNLSSDVDLVMLYDQQGFTDGNKSISNQEFFLRIARQVIKSLDETTAHGFVFRVDMRLRPFGESGPLIQHWNAIENYFLEHGRDWERYAFIKARAIAGDIELGERFLEMLKPFVYRRHLDYGAIESLREMKLLINRQVELNELQDDLKLGPGGIREVEFIAQAHQLIWGGNNEKLRERRLLKVLGVMADERLLPLEEIDRLKEAYVFLRNSEHAVQGDKDRQTHQLPADEISMGNLADAMGFTEQALYQQALAVHREHVSSCFNSFMSSSQAEHELLLEGDLHWPGVWRDPHGQKSVLTITGFNDADAVAERLKQFTEAILHQGLQDLVIERINKLMPLLLSLVAKQSDADATLSRVLPIIEAIERRSTYVSYLLENTDALKRTIELCAMSPWVATRLNEYPIFLYELSDRSIDEFSFEPAELTEQLNEALLLIEEEDLESQMDKLRVFKNAAVLRVAVCELLDLLPLMKASDALTNIAEVVLQQSLDLAWNYLVSRHGQPQDREGKTLPRQFAIIAYGKLGGIELAYESDLDLVFLFDADIHGATNGGRSINNNVFFLRLVQRVIHILTSFTRFGTLYETDMRLRPAGNKGAMVSTVSSFERYQLEEAWTWEHQALIRARFVAGDTIVREKFESVRKTIIEYHRDWRELKQDVVEMREKMRAHLLGEREQPQLLTSVDLKHEIGAIVDIEFMVQYAVLAWAHEHQALSEWTDMMRLLDEIKDHELMSQVESELLQKAYLAYRRAVHYQSLGGEVISFDTLQEYRQVVYGVWQRFMLDESGEA